MAEGRAARGGFKGPWHVVTTRAFDGWFRGLEAEPATQVAAAKLRVSIVGPTLGRPRVDSIKGSRVHNLKELRVQDGVRVLFAFDPNRRAVMLVGGNKTGTWERWYRKMMPVAERLYADHLRSLGKGSDHCLSRPAATQNRSVRSR
jgi:hypothetical protein